MLLKYYKRGDSLVMMKYDEMDGFCTTLHRAYKLIEVTKTPTPKYWQAHWAFDKYRKKVNYCEGQKERRLWEKLIKTLPIDRTYAHWPRLNGDFIDEQ